MAGTVDGFIEVWDYMKGEVRKDLQYQVRTQFTHHNCFGPRSIKSFPWLIKAINTANTAASLPCLPALPCQCRILLRAGA